MELEFIDFESGDARALSSAAPKSISTNISITDAAANNNQLVVDFDYTAAYSPDGSHIRISGKAGFRGKEVKKAQAEWKKTGSISGVSGELILNAINFNASVNALLISKAFNLTPPIVLPTLKLGKAAQTKRTKKK